MLPFLSWLSCPQHSWRLVKVTDYPDFCVWVVVVVVKTVFQISTFSVEVESAKIMKQDWVDNFEKITISYYLHTYTILNSHTFSFWYINHWGSPLSSRSRIWLYGNLFLFASLYENSQHSGHLPKSRICRMGSWDRMFLCGSCRHCY